MTYDAQDRLTEEITAQGVIGYAHDVLGRRRSVSADGRISMTYDYDRNSRLKTLTQSGWGTATLDYFITGQLQRRTLPNRFSTRYEYDDTGRVTRLVYERMAGAALGDLTYGYDMAGRRTTMGGSLARTLLPDSASASSYDVANQQLLFGNYTSTYDRNGNVTSVLARRLRDPRLGRSRPPAWRDACRCDLDLRLRRVRPAQPPHRRRCRLFLSVRGR